MSLWNCPVHGLYGGDVFCPQCGGGGEYVTLRPTVPPAIADRNAERQDHEDGLGPEDESGGAEGNRTENIA